MKRGTSEERRWENGLRQNTRTSYAVRCRTGPVSESKRSSGKVAATAALQAYLLHDKDARSKIPRFAEVKSKEREILAKIRESGDVESENSATAHTTATSGAESPLSRFQKHVRLIDMKQAQFQPDRRELPGRNHRVGLIQTGQSLTRSLMDKIQEAKDLRHSEESSKYRRRTSSPSGVTGYGSQATRETISLPLQSSAFLKISPPVPHAKPVIPVISTFSSSSQPFLQKTTVKYQHSEEEATVATPKEPVSIISGVIKATNAASLIQRVWRRKLSSRGEPEIPELSRNEATLIIDKHVENVAPLLAEVKLTHHTNDASEAAADDVAAISAVKNDQVAGVSSSMRAAGGNLPCYDPWTDHDLIFLEEGRCFELQENIHRRSTMDQDELVWKRPQLVIQQLETRRMSTIQKTRRKRGKPHQQVESPSTTETMEAIERGNELCAKAVFTEKKLRRDLKCPRLKHRSGNGKVSLRAGQGPAERRKMFTRARTHFCHISNSTNKPRDGDRNHSNQADNDIVDIANDQRDGNSQVLKSDTAAFNRFVVFSDPTEATDANGSKSLRNDLICVGDLALARSLLCENGHPHSSDIVEHHNDVIPLTQLLSDPLVNEHPDGQEGQLVQVASEDLARGYSASLDSTDSYASTDSCTAEDAAQLLSQSTTDSMMKSGITNPIAGMQDEYSPACNQLLESASIIPVAELRLDEVKRLEFLRALNDFKCCLRPSSCASSTMTLHGFSSLHRAVEAEVLASELNIQSETVDVALGYGNSDSDL
ncbi:hypothetical protein DVH05_011744 [Phytophthora capsici]|nr:hypothetical protein DVH05_011744 [Phytophthora capsici]